MIFSRLNKNNKENIVVNANLKQKPIGQIGHSITVLSGEMFKFDDNKQLAVISIGIDTNVYLDMLLDLKDIKDDKSLSPFFLANIKDDFDKIVTEQDDDYYMYLDDGILCVITDKYNQEIIKESYK